RDRPPGAGPARPPLLPQGSVPVPLLHPPRRHGKAGGGVARPRPPDRSAPPGVPPVDVADLAGQGSGPATALLRRGRGDGPRPAGLLAAVLRPGRAYAARPLAALAGASERGAL